MLLTHESSDHFSNITFSTTSANSANVLSPALHNALAQRLRQLLSEPELLCQHLYSRLISISDPAISENRPVLPMADLALVYELRFTRSEFPEAFTSPTFASQNPDADAAFSLSIDYALLKAMQMSPSALFTATARTMQQRHPVQISSMEEVLGFPAPSEPLLVVITTVESHHGAGAILYDGAAEQVAAILGEFFILPSSIHEVLAVRRDARLRICELKELVQNINRQEVSPEDRLSDHVYKLIKNPTPDPAEPAYIFAFADDYDTDYKDFCKEASP